MPCMFNLRRVIENSDYRHCHWCGVFIERPLMCGLEYLRGFSHKFPDGKKLPAFPDGKLYQVVEEDKNQRALF